MFNSVSNLKYIIIIKSSIERVSMYCLKIFPIKPYWARLMVTYRKNKCRTWRHLVFHKQLFVLAFTLLISNTAACLASRLTRSLALTAAAVLCALAEILCFKSLDFHYIRPPNILISSYYNTTLSFRQWIFCLS